MTKDELLQLLYTYINPVSPNGTEWSIDMTNDGAIDTGGDFVPPPPQPPSGVGFSKIGSSFIIY